MCTKRHARRDFLKRIGLGAAAAAATHLQATEGSKGKPNIIFVLADDVGEKRDLAGKPLGPPGGLPEKAAELKEALAKHYYRDLARYAPINTDRPSATILPQRAFPDT